LSRRCSDAQLLLLLLHAHPKRLLPTGQVVSLKMRWFHVAGMLLLDVYLFS
jgi:hypothetical protein